MSRSQKKHTKRSFNAFEQWHLNKKDIVGDRGTQEEWNSVCELYTSKMPGAKYTATDAFIEYDSQLATFFKTQHESIPTLAEKIFKKGQHIAQQRMEPYLQLRKEKLPEAVTEQEWETLGKNISAYGFMKSECLKKYQLGTLQLMFSVISKMKKIQIYLKPRSTAVTISALSTALNQLHQESLKV